MHTGLDDKKAVLFDLDGTLIDTEKIYRVYWPKACKHFGFDLQDWQYLELRSLGRPFVRERFRQWFGEEFDYDAVKEYRKVIMEEYLNTHGIEVKKGAFELLEHLTKNGYTVAIATATDIQRTTKYLKLTGLDKYITNIISATEVEKGKPDPGVYLYACQKLGLSPSECVAVEDSPNGIMSAYKAGLSPVLIPDQDRPDEALEQICYAVLDSLECLINFF